MRLSDNRYESHRRKYTLALSMIEHGARIRTVTRVDRTLQIFRPKSHSILREQDPNSLQSRHVSV